MTNGRVVTKKPHKTIQLFICVGNYPPKTRKGYITASSGADHS